MTTTTGRVDLLKARETHWHVALAKAAAASEGKSMSEYIRGAVRRAVDETLRSSSGR